MNTIKEVMDSRLELMKQAETKYYFDGFPPLEARICILEAVIDSLLEVLFEIENNDGK